MTTYLLVSFKTCPWVQRAAIALREKNIAFEFRHIDPDNRPDWFLAISPHKKVPVLRIDEKLSLFESNAIAEYLDETTEPRLHPNDPVLRAIDRAWTDYLPTFANLVTAGVRLIPLGQTDGQLAIAELEEAVLATSAHAKEATTDDLGSAAFMVDLASMAHETQYTRLFRS